MTDGMIGLGMIDTILRRSAFVIYQYLCLSVLLLFKDSKL